LIDGLYHIQHIWLVAVNSVVSPEMLPACRLVLSHYREGAPKTGQLCLTAHIFKMPEPISDFLVHFKHCIVLNRHDNSIYRVRQ